MAKAKGGFLRIPALEAAVVAVLKGINGIVGNYGVAIIIVTIIVRALMFPLTLKQEKSMKKMRELQPQLDKLKEKYKDKPQELQQKTAEIYKENNVNPLSGCLPILIQMPIFIALFYAFSGDAIPNDATFLWFNLKKPDELFKIGTFTVNLLPILNTAITFFQQKIMSGSSKGQEVNSQMQTMMYTMPLMMLLLFYKMPSGVTLYYLVSGALSLVQQYFIMKGRD
ncbi:YidC/Oxa1 family membrane protein insertase [Leptotrichia sp. OH3620_COT-345]|uniref:YidC/Oxa1 family membrane protein insertase n=1 Tax=Leptotrichia sp. OH3620_COT-345 TaxID=2491048 RepID=UPI000F64B273|nr:YidC/Oxa1 family membrane protein insertase [Leptotrichia sp. OH3620_COT-345]RRD40736.1 YidC/Oxa1 family membrane protein insertase [Leptotrichia sp. OH3620_COT-345]